MRLSSTARDPSGYTAFGAKLATNDSASPVTRLVDIGAKVANFEPPYEYLKNVRAGFDAEIRFMLDRCLKGDVPACAARDAWVFREKNWYKEVSLEANEIAWRDFFVAHNFGNLLNIVDGNAIGPDTLPNFFFIVIEQCHDREI